MISSSILLLNVISKNSKGITLNYYQILSNLSILSVLILIRVNLKRAIKKAVILSERMTIGLFMKSTSRKE